MKFRTQVSETSSELQEAVSVFSPWPAERLSDSDAQFITMLMIQADIYSVVRLNINRSIDDLQAHLEENIQQLGGSDALRQASWDLLAAYYPGEHRLCSVTWGKLLGRAVVQTRKTIPEHKALWSEAAQAQLRVELTRVMKKTDDYPACH